ncbi:MAG: hypothetical protein ACNYPI_01285 [Arenicellales bacterium WSBS_2016_MAG_OTU3]
MSVATFAGIWMVIVPSADRRRRDGQGVGHAGHAMGRYGRATGDPNISYRVKAGQARRTSPPQKS